jgi:hypothetical protein
MNYMGNPRRLKSHPRSSERGYVGLQRLVTPTPSERPPLDICHAFQSQSTSSYSGYGSFITSSSGSHDEDTFEIKRRKLLSKTDWVGLDIFAPINVRSSCRKIKVDLRHTRRKGTEAASVWSIHETCLQFND